MISRLLNYPMLTVQIVGAPAFFPTVWEWIKRWFDPITVSKIFILSEAQAFKTLSSFIDPENIPEKYGGKLSFTFGGGPVLDPRLASRIEFKDPSEPWPRGPLKWEREADGQDITGADLESVVVDGDSVGVWKLFAVGSDGGKERRKHIATFTPEPIPPKDEDNEIPDEAPDRSIDFATQKVKFNPRSSWAGSLHSRASWASANSNPSSPTAHRRPSTSGSAPLSRSATKERIEEEKGETVTKTAEKPATKEEKPDAKSNEKGHADQTTKQADEKTVTRNGVAVPADAVTSSAKTSDSPATTGDAAKLPPSETAPGDVPLEATATALPDEKNV